MSDITIINDSEQSSLVTNGLAKNGELYLKAEGSTDAGAIVVYDSGAWRTFANEALAFTNSYSLEFDGTNDFARSDSTFAGSQISVSVWINFPSINDNEYIVWSPTYQLRMRTSGPRLSYSGYDQIRPGAQYGGFTPATNTWHHLVTTSDGSAHKMYWDGSLLASKTQDTMTSTTTFRVGGYGSYYIGKIDELAIWHSVLSGSDVTAIYNSGAADDLSTYNPLYWYRMGDNDNGSGPISDAQGNGANMSLNNGPVFSSDTP